MRLARNKSDFSPERISTKPADPRAVRFIFSALYSCFVVCFLKFIATKIFSWNSKFGSLDLNNGIYLAQRASKYPMAPTLNFNLKR